MINYNATGSPVMECADCLKGDREALLVQQWLAPEGCYGWLCYEHVFTYNESFAPREWTTPWVGSAPKPKA
jgi:hypothetical protein